MFFSLFLGPLHCGEGSGIFNGIQGSRKEQAMLTHLGDFHVRGIVFLFFFFQKLGFLPFFLKLFYVFLFLFKMLQTAVIWTPETSPGSGSGFASGMTAILAAASWGKAKSRTTSGGTRPSRQMLN